MMPDERFHDAVRRADVGWLSGHLDARVCPPAVFGRLIQHADPPVRHLGLVLLAERVASAPAVGGPEPAELAALLPVSVEGTPETALVLAGLYERLGPFVRRGSWPSWRTAGLPVRVRIAWLRAELLNEPAVIREEAPGELLYQAVRETSAAAAHRPARLVDELSGSGDPVLRAEALRLARQGLRAGLLAPARVRDVLLGLLGGDSAVAVSALKELNEPWAALDPLPPGRLSPFLAAGSVVTGPAAADAALAVAAHHGHGGTLWQVIGDPGLPPGLRRRGMELMADLADRGDIGELTAIAAGDPLLFGGPLVTCLPAGDGLGIECGDLGIRRRTPGRRTRRTRRGPGCPARPGPASARAGEDQAVLPARRGERARGRPRTRRDDRAGSAGAPRTVRG